VVIRKVVNFMLVWSEKCVHKNGDREWRGTFLGDPKRRKLSKCMSRLATKGAFI